MPSPIVLVAASPVLIPITPITALVVLVVLVVLAVLIRLPVPQPPCLSSSSPGTIWRGRSEKTGESSSSGGHRDGHSHPRDQSALHEVVWILHRLSRLLVSEPCIEGVILV